MFERAALNKLAASKDVKLKTCKDLNEKARNSIQLDSLRSTLVNILESTHKT
jgi:hypothetical protein